MHAATALAVLWLLRADLAAILAAGLDSLRQRTLAGDPGRKLAWLLLLATLPGAAVGFLLQDLFEELFQRPREAGLFLLLTAALLVAGERLRRGEGTLLQLTPGGALLIGLAQALAIAPGISRSGATITAGLVIGLSRRESARFSFLLSLPIILGAFAAQLPGLSASGISVPQLAVATLAAFLAGAAAIRGLLAYLARRSLYPFAAYCLLLSVLTLWAAG